MDGKIYEDLSVDVPGDIPDDAWYGTASDERPEYSADDLKFDLFAKYKSFLERSKKAIELNSKDNDSAEEILINFSIIYKFVYFFIKKSI